MKIRALGVKTNWNNDNDLSFSRCRRQRLMHVTAFSPLDETIYFFNCQENVTGYFEMYYQTHIYWTIHQIIRTIPLLLHQATHSTLPLLNHSDQSCVVG